MTRFSKAVWHGDGATGSGELTTQTGVLKNQPYSFKARFGDDAGKTGTNPEELIAAAHAGCYTMALSFGLAGAGFKPETLETTAELELKNQDGGFVIAGIHLKLTGKVPGITADKFQELAAAAKVGCPVSKALAAISITLDATLLPA
jgi:osmotically inducible protein OsmC